MERRVHHSIYELLQQDRYTLEEVSELLGIGSRRATDRIGDEAPSLADDRAA
jgi:hypothetical protein